VTYQQFVCLGMILLVSSCSHFDHHDPSLSLKANDYEKKLLETAPLPPTKVFKADRVQAAPLLPGVFQKPVSLTATNGLALRDLLLELATQAGVSVSVAENVEGSLTLHAHHKPFMEILKQICEAGHLRYQVRGQSLHIEKDTPFVKTHNIQFLSMIRESINRISIATDVFSSIDGKQNELDNGSNTMLTGTSKTDFWEDLKKNLTLVLQEGATHESSPEPFSLHAQAGLLSVLATTAQHERIAQYLTMLQKAASSQVLIEAKIVEVNLKKEFNSGINWQSLKGDFALQAPLGSITTPGPFNVDAVPPRNVFTIGGHGRHLSGLISFMQHFGTVRTLSNPRLTVVNNQSAVLKVATNRVFFRINYERDYSFENSSREREHVSSEIQTVPIGLVMVVQPSINLQDGSIVMTVRPTISRVVGEKEDPAVSIVSQQKLTSLVPEIQVREMDSVFRLKSGEVVLMGGLMEESATHDQNGVPEVSDIPLLGALFKGKDDHRCVNELVIFLRATIIDPHDHNTPLYQETGVGSADTQVYDNFTQDPRPWEMLAPGPIEVS
jgi:MSHA type pilus biogenesis protein MshL